MLRINLKSISNVYHKKYTMKNLLLLLLFTLPMAAFSQKIKLKVDDQKDTTVFLVKYYGKNILYADTAEMVKGVVTFDGSKQKPGMLGLLLPGQKFFEFIYNKDEIDIETKGPDYVANMKVKKSEENILFLSYINYLKTSREKANALMDQSRSLDKNSKEYKDLMNQVDGISGAVKTFQVDFAEKNKGKLVGKIVKMSTDVEIPEAPKNEKGQVIDSNFRYYYYREHYFDNIDLRDDRLVNTAMFHQKIEYFFGDKFLLQIPDTIAVQAISMLDKMDYRSEMFKYTLTHIMVNAEKSKIMGMDKLFTILGDRYYCKDAPDGKSYVDWMTSDKLEELCKKIKTNKNLVVGAKAINIKLTDSTEVNWHDFYSLKSDYVILYFWEATCGHCKKSTPLLQKLYAEKLKARNVEVFGISKAIGEDFKTWKKFISDNKLSFINVALTDKIYKEAQKDPYKFIPHITTIESLNYSDTYDIYSTPRVFVLDKDKKIIGKGLTISQLEDFMDRVQKVENAKKIIPADKNKEDEHDEEHH